MVEHGSSGRKDTGRTDKYSDETPRKDYQDYRKDVPGERVARKESKSISDGFSPKQFLGIPGLSAASQYLKSTAENFNPNDVETSNRRINAAVELWRLVSSAVPGSVSESFEREVKDCLVRLK